MKHLLYVVAAGLTLAAGCSDMFAPPPLPDLSKDPYDFAVVVPPYRDGGSDDMPRVTPHDLAMGGTSSD